MIGRAEPRDGRIHKLPDHLVNQIAAGEVIERPASAVKELVENAIDAGAVRISIEIEEGGMRSIAVTDDGGGIEAEDLPLAVASHATSKLRTSEDLARILTLGFRGEALASMASVGELDILSRTPRMDAGERVTARDGGVERGRPEPMAPGTRVTLRNLFYSVPARKRFLRSERAEGARVTAVVHQFALALPGIGFALRHGGRLVLDYPPHQTMADRIGEVLGSEWSARLLTLAPSPELSGWISRPEFARRDTHGVHVFLNGRAIRDAVVLSALRQGYQGFQIPGKNPVAVLALALDPAAVDVNVHPAKLEVRFRDSTAVFSRIVRAVRDALEAAGCVPSLFPWGPPSQAAATGPAAQRSAQPATFYGPEREDHDARNIPPPDWREMLPTERALPRVSDRVAEAGEPRAFQVRASFIVVEERDGLVVIDQHALHEKIIYEELRARPSASPMRQPLLLPETCVLDAARWMSFVDAGTLLAELGFEVEEFGDRTIVIRAVPAGFDDLPAAALVGDLLDRLGAAERSGAQPSIDLRNRALETMACKRAVKAGQPLGAAAIADLLAGRARATDPRHCPHGRPAELFISWSELERRFDRR